MKHKEITLNGKTYIMDFDEHPDCRIVPLTLETANEELEQLASEMDNISFGDLHKAYRDFYFRSGEYPNELLVTPGSIYFKKTTQGG